MKLFLLLFLFPFFLFSEDEIFETKTATSLYETCPIKKALFQKTPIEFAKIPVGTKLKILNMVENKTWFSSTIKTWAEVDFNGMRGCILMSEEKK